MNYDVNVDKNKTKAQLINELVELRRRNIELKELEAERKWADELIREQAILLDKANDGTFILSLQHRIIHWYSGAEHLYGWSAEDAIGKNVIELLSRGNPSQLFKARKVLMEKGQWTGELHEVTKSDKEIIVTSNWTLAYDDEGKPNSILVINTDIEEEKKLEEKFLRSQRLEAIGTLAVGIAHDLINAFHPMTMFLKILRSKFSDEISSNTINMLQSNVNRGADLVNQILSYAKEQKSEHTTLQLRHVVCAIENIIKRSFPKTIEIHIEVPEELWLISGDLIQLDQCLMNLCLNARDAMPNGGNLSISGENFFVDEIYVKMNREFEPGPYIVVTVSDTGAGIPSEIIDKIFDPFYTTKESDKRTGLGLSTAFKIVKNHGGVINVYSELDKGTRFKIYLPAIESAELDKRIEENLEPLIGNGELILVVDDEASIREITKATLELSGYRSITASDGTEALIMCAEKREEIKAVILDINMPIMDGLVTIMALNKINPKLKIIASNGLNETDKLRRGAAEVQGILRKPYTLETLLKTLQTVL
ncbi:MAG: ATP-binding protein [Thermodesulfobacteriota bacterium]